VVPALHVRHEPLHVGKRPELRPEEQLRVLDVRRNGHVRHRQLTPQQPLLVAQDGFLARGLSLCSQRSVAVETHIQLMTASMFHVH
jgi:hypothetical protein